MCCFFPWTEPFLILTPHEVVHLEVVIVLYFLSSTLYGLCVYHPFSYADGEWVTLGKGTS